MNQTTPNNAALAPSSTFISGAEHKDMIGHYIDCSANPYDLRPAADIILKAAFATRETMPNDQPLVILMHDPHTIPSPLELQHLLAFHFQEQDFKFTFNLEGDHDTWGAFARYSMKREISDKLYYKSSDYDPNGQAALSGTLGYSDIEMAPTSYLNLAAFLYDKKIPTIFNDASSMHGGFDLKDPYTASLIRQKGLEGLSSNFSTQEDMPKRMHIRNLSMADRGIKAAKSLQKNTILQHLGGAHIFGWEEAGCNYETSLCAAYRAAGATVLPVFITTREHNFGLNILPEAAYSELPHSVVIDGLAEDQFKIGEEKAERACIAKIHAESGGELDFYDVAARKEEYKALAHTEADALIARYEETLEP